MMTTMLHREKGGKAEREPGAGRVLGLLLRRKGMVLLAALLLMILAGVTGRDAGDKLTSGAYLDPSAESQRAAGLLVEEFPGGPANLVLIAEASTGSVDAPAAAESGRELTRRLVEMPGVGGVTSYWTTPDPSLRTADGSSALIALQLTGGEHAAQEAASRIIDDLEDIEETSSGLQVSASGSAAVGLAVDEQAESDLISAEMVTFQRYDGGPRVRAGGVSAAGDVIEAAPMPPKEPLLVRHRPILLAMRAGLGSILERAKADGIRYLSDNSCRPSACLRPFPPTIRR